MGPGLQGPVTGPRLQGLVRGPRLQGPAGQPTGPVVERGADGTAGMTTPAGVQDEDGAPGVTTGVHCGTLDEAEQPKTVFRLEV